MFGKSSIRGSTKPKDPEKKLRDFHDPKSTQLKKFKSLVGYCGMYKFYFRLVVNKTVHSLYTEKNIYTSFRICHKYRWS